MPSVDWSRYRKCRVCLAELGKPCATKTGAIVEGAGYVANAITLQNDQPHTGRQLRTGYGR